MTPQIEVDRNYVTIQGVRVERPSSMPPTQWLEYFETAEGKSEIDELEAKVEELEDDAKTHEDDLTAAYQERDDALKEVKTLKAKIKAVEDALY